MVTEAKSIGEALREARENKGLLLEDVTRTTRIGKQHLQAMEADEFSKLPNPTYARGFLRSYASFLGLPADEIVKRFDDLVAEQTAAPMQEKKPKRGAPTGGDGVQRKWVLPLVLLLVAGITAYLVGRGGEEQEKQIPAPETPAVTPPPVQPQVTTSVQEPVGPPAPAQPQPSPAAPSPPAVAPAPPSQPAPPVKKGVFLRLIVSEETFLNITIDGNISKRYQLKPGDIIEWKGEKSFALDLGNAGGVTADFNGRRLKPFGPRGESAHIVLNAQ